MGIVRNLLVIVSVIMVIAIFVLLVFDANKIKKDENYKPKSNKYIIMIAILLMLFIVFGILRNF